MWKPIIIKGEKTNYMINKNGQIKNKKGQIIHNRVVVKNKKTKCQSKTVLCSLNIKGKVTSYRIVRLMAEAFIPNPNNYKYAVLQDGNIKNINVNNIIWTKDGNSNQIERHWKNETFNNVCCENNISAKLTNEQVLYIKKIFKKGDKHFGINPLGKKYGVHPNTIRNIVNEKTWKKLDKFIEG